MYVLDETAIPSKVKYIRVRNTAQAVSVIRKMQTRAFGQFLVVLNAFLLEIDRVGATDVIFSDLPDMRLA